MPTLGESNTGHLAFQEDRSGLPLGRRAIGQTDEHDLLKSALGIDAAEDELLEIVGSL